MSKQILIRLGINPDGSPVVKKKIDGDLTTIDLMVMLYALDDIRTELTQYINKNAWKVVEFKKKDDVPGGDL